MCMTVPYSAEPLSDAMKSANNLLIEISHCTASYYRHFIPQGPQLNYNGNAALVTFIYL